MQMEALKGKKKYGKMGMIEHIQDLFHTCLRFTLEVHGVRGNCPLGV